MLVSSATTANWLVVLLLVFFSTTDASSGDRESIFLNCVAKCKFNSCSSTASKTPLPLELRLTFWTCPENCQYDCMHQVTATHIMEGERIHQYYGKWPFIRLWGLQEPASVLFSILNFWAHYKGLLRLRRQIPERYFMLHFYKMHSYLALNAWVWSTVFHARDRPWTEKFDYFSAMLYILFSAYQGFVRVFHIRSIAGLTGLTGLTALGYLAHVTYLSFWPFDYTYNMVAGVVVGVASNIMWIGWCLKNWRTRPYAWKMLLSIVLISSAMSLELLDFPPIWFVFDAHSLWHAATVPVVFIFYDFLVSDSLHEMRLKKGKQAIR